MPTSTLRVRGVAALAYAALVSGCSAQSASEAAQDALRHWLTAVENGDSSACRLETPAYHAELMAEAGRPRAARSCGERVERMVGDAQPAADSTMDVPVWDPSGEALLEVVDARSGDTRTFWMVFEDDRWLVDSDGEGRPERTGRPPSS